MGGMRSFAIRGGLAAVALATLLFVWFFTAQWCSMLVDRVYTAPMTVVQSTPFGWNGTFLQFGSAIPGLVGLQGFNRGELLTGAHLLELSGPGPDYKQAASLEINANIPRRHDTRRRRTDPSLRGRAWRHDLRYPRTQPVGLASIVQLGRDLFERAADDLATPSLLSVILDKGLGRTTRYGLALRAGVRGD